MLRRLCHSLIVIGGGGGRTQPGVPLPQKNSAFSKLQLSTCMRKLLTGGGGGALPASDCPAQVFINIDKKIEQRLSQSFQIIS